MGYNIRRQWTLTEKEEALMRKLTVIIAALILSLLAFVPALSAEKTLMQELLLPKKDMCLLLAKNCRDNTYVIQQRIERLQEEINKGPLVYSEDELNLLRKRLDDANRELEFIYNEGA
jgi:hypothetical protein